MEQTYISLEQSCRQGEDVQMGVTIATQGRTGATPSLFLCTRFLSRFVTDAQGKQYTRAFSRHTECCSFFVTHIWDGGLPCMFRHAGDHDVPTDVRLTPADALMSLWWLCSVRG